MANDQKPVISVRKLRKVYMMGQEHVVALHNIDLDIPRGEVCCIFGTSGSGKSTLLRCLNLLEQPTSGTIYFKDVALNGKKVNLDLHRREMGMVFQHFNLFPHLTVKQNLCLAPELLKLKSKEEASKRAEELLARVGLSDKANVFPKSLSGGQQQRIAIARALLLSPEVIICDECVSALDVSIQAQIVNLLLDLREQKSLTYLLISHDLSMVRHLSDRILVMYLGGGGGGEHGAGAVYPPPAPLHQGPHCRHPHSRSQGGTGPPPQRAAGTGPPVPWIRLPAARFAGRCPYATDRCRMEKPALCDMGGGHRVACHLCR